VPTGTVNWPETGPALLKCGSRLPTTFSNILSVIDAIVRIMTPGAIRERISPDGISAGGTFAGSDANERRHTHTNTGTERLCSLYLLRPQASTDHMSGELVASEPERISTFCKGCRPSGIIYSIAPHLAQWCESCGASRGGCVRVRARGGWSVVCRRIADLLSSVRPRYLVEARCSLFATMLHSPCHFAGASFRRGSTDWILNVCTSFEIWSTRL
jgi:hypothetical protein